ncbi:hypothetical protein KIPB_015179, partial [Kipferlia bialata]
LSVISEVSSLTVDECLSVCDALTDQLQDVAMNLAPVFEPFPVLHVCTSLIDGLLQKVVRVMTQDLTIGRDVRAQSEQSERDTSLDGVSSPERAAIEREREKEREREREKETQGAVNDILSIVTFSQSYESNLFYLGMIY